MCGRSGEEGGADGRALERRPCRHAAQSKTRKEPVEDKEGAGEVDADVEVEAQGRRVVGDANPISYREK